MIITESDNIYSNIKIIHYLKVIKNIKIFELLKILSS